MRKWEKTAKKDCEKYQNLSKEEKEKMQQHVLEHYKNLFKKQNLL